MIRWVDERNCIIDKDGKETKYNVNRLIKQNEWDGDHLDTSGVLQKRILAPKPITQSVAKTPNVEPITTPPEVGEVIIFAMEMTPRTRKNHQSAKQ